MAKTRSFLAEGTLYILQASQPTDLDLAFRAPRGWEVEGQDDLWTEHD